MANITDILILEDNKDDLGLIKRELKKINNSVNIRESHNEKSFKDHLCKKLPDIVLSDFMIPGYGGDSAFEELRTHSKNIPFILVSGTVGEQKAVELMRKGVSDFILKDNLARLNTAIEREVREYRNKLEAESIYNELLLFREIFRNSNDSVCILDSDGVILSHNLADEKLLGYTIEDLKGKTPAIFFGEEAFRNNLETARRVGRFSVETTLESRYGQKKTVQINLIKITESSGSTKFSCIKHDITEIKDKEQQLIKKADELQEINSLMIGRELKMIELKKEINELLKEAGKQEKYEI